MSSEFSDRPFVAGTVTGIRSFKVQPDGPTGRTLRGPSYGGDFLPGENLASCTVDKYARPGASVVLTFTGFKPGAKNAATAVVNVGTRPVPASAQLATTRLLNHMVRTHSLVELRTMTESMGIEYVVEPVDTEEPAHRPGQMHCTCGYYAYLDLKNNPHDHYGNVLGLVEGYGVVTVGTRGFRAEKARLVAMIGQVVEALPGPPDEGHVFDWDFGEDDLNSNRYILKWVAEMYPVPIFPTVETAVAEYPLTDVS